MATPEIKPAAPPPPSPEALAAAMAKKAAQEQAITDAKGLMKKQEDARDFTRKLRKNPKSAIADIQKQVRDLPGKEAPTVAQAKSTLEAAIAKSDPGMQWLTDSASGLKANKEAMLAVADILQEGAALQNDPHFFLKKGAEMYWKSRSNGLTADARHELLQVEGRIFERLGQLRGGDEAFRYVSDEHILMVIDADLQMYRAKELTKRVNELGDDIEDNKIKDEAIKARLEKIQKRLKFDSSYVKDVDQIKREKQEIIEMASDANEHDVHEAVNRIDNLMRSAQEVEERQQRMLRIQESADYSEGQVGKRAIRYTKEMDEHFHNTKLEVGDLIPVARLREQDIEFLQECLDKDPATGLSKFLAKMRQDIYDLGNQQGRPGFDDETTLNDFFASMETLYGDEQQFKAREMHNLWKAHEKADSIIKGITNPGDIEKKTGALAFISPADLEFLLSTELVEYAHTDILNAIGDVMKNQQMRYNEVSALYTSEIPPELRARLDKEQPDIVKKFKGGKITREKLWKELEAAYNNYTPDGHGHEDHGHANKNAKDHGVVVDNPYKPTSTTGMGNLSSELYDEMHRIAKMRDTLFEGVVLRDRHMMFNQKSYGEMIALVRKYRDASFQLDKLPQGDPARQKFIDIQKIATRDYQAKWAEFDINTFDAPKIHDYAEFDAISQYAPVDIVARSRLKRFMQMNYVKDNGWDPAKLDPTQQKKLADYMKANEWKIREAVMAARKIAIGTGSAMQIASRMAIAPKTKDAKGRDFMTGGFAEAYMRVINPYMFRDRFGMGGKVGSDLIADLYYVKECNRIGINLESDPKVPKEYKKLVRDARVKGEPIWPVYMQYLEEVYGIQWTELMRPDTFSTGLQSLSTTWREERAKLEPIKDHFARLKEQGALGEGSDGIIDNTALSLQLATSSKDVEHNPLNKARREKIFDKMLARQPLAFIQLYGKELDARLTGAGIDVRSGSEDWYKFQSVLGVAQKQMWSDPRLASSNVSLLNEKDFNEIVMPVVYTYGLTEADGKRYLAAIRAVKDFMGEKVDATGLLRRDHLLKYNFKQFYVLAEGDYNIRQADYLRLGMMDTERRINDFRNQAKFEGQFFEFMFDKYTDFLFPDKGKEAESMMKIEEMTKTIIGYAGTEDAENTRKNLLEFMIDMNENKARRNIIGWIPGATRMLKGMKQVEPEYWPLPNFILGKDGHGHPRWHKFLEENGLFGVPFERWPTSLAEAVSYHSGLIGRDGNKWDENRIESLIAMAEDRLWFQEKAHKGYYHDLRDRYKTHPGDRLMGQARTYWWVVPSAMLVLALTSSIEEEKKKGQHH